MPAPFGHANDLLGFNDGWRQEFFGEDVLSGLHCVEHDRAMRAGGCGDGHRVDVVAREQIVEVTDKDRIDGVGRFPPASRIVVPNCDKLGVRVLVYLRGVLGCMYVPESQNRNRDRIGHGKSFPRESERLPHCQSTAASTYLSGIVARTTRPLHSRGAGIVLRKAR
jgi:hypothetical protein